MVVVVLLWTILKFLLNLLHHCFYFMFWDFDCEACGIFTPWPGIEPISPALEDEVLTTGPPGKSQEEVFPNFYITPQFSDECPSGARISSATIYLPGLRRPLEKVSKVGHFSLFEREPAASVVRANLVSRVILIFRINQATQLLFSTKFSYWAILILFLFIISN